MAANLPLAFGSLLAGGILLEHGVTSVKTAFAGGTATATAAAAPQAGSTGSVTSAQLASIGKQHGWSGQQLTDWMNIINAESNGTVTDTNPTSGAYGIAQMFVQAGDIAANKAKYYTYGGNPDTVTGQLTAMANYIAQRYGTPSAAWTYHQANSSY